MCVRSFTQPVLAALVLLAVEIVWMDDLALVASPARLGVLTTSLLTVTCVVGSLAAVLRRLAVPVRPVQRAIVFAIFGRLGRHGRLARAASRRLAAVVALCAFVACLLSAWADTHILLGRDVVVRVLLGGVTVASALTTARAMLLCVPTPRLSTRLGVTCAVACVVAPWATWAAWSSDASLALAAYSDGLVPDMRLVVNTLRAAPPGASTSPLAQDATVRGVAAVPIALAHGPSTTPPPPASATTPNARPVPTDSRAATDPLAAADVIDVPLDDWTWSPTEDASEPRPAPETGDTTFVSFAHEPTSLLRTASDVAAAADAGRGEWRARLSARTHDATRRALTLTLVDGSGLVATQVAATLDDGSTDLVTPWTRLGRPILPGSFDIEPSECTPESGAAFTVALPPAWEAFASSVESPTASRVALFEDELPLGPSNALHRTVRAVGRGAYSHWNDVLYFSTSDGSDPRDNGRRYRLVLLPDEPPSRSARPRLEVAHDGEPLDAWLRDVHLERRAEPVRVPTSGVETRVVVTVEPSAVDASLDAVPAEIVAGFRDGEPDPAWVRELLREFWTLPEPARPWILRAFYRHDLTELRFQLELLERGRFEDDDQRVLAVRAWAGSRTAAERLVERFDDLSDVGRTWLAELLPDLPSTNFDLLAERLLSEFARLASLAPALGSPDERRLALLASGLPLQLGRRTPRAVRRALVERFNAYSVDDPGPAFATLGREPFTRSRLLTALCHGLAEDGLELLDSLTLNRDVAITVPETCLALDSEASRRFLLALIARWKIPGDANGAELSYMLPALRRIDDDGFREEANRILRRDYPLVWVHP